MSGKRPEYWGVGDADAQGVAVIAADADTLSAEMIRHEAAIREYLHRETDVCLELASEEQAALKSRVKELEHALAKEMKGRLVERDAAKRIYLDQQNAYSLLQNEMSAKRAIIDSQSECLLAARSEQAKIGAVGLFCGALMACVAWGVCIFIR
jgi:hypothetical protein